VLAGTGATLVDDRLAHGLENRPHALDRLLVASDHDREGRVSGADVAARNGRIDRVDAALLGRCVDLHRERRVAGRHVDDDGAGRSTLQNALSTEDHFTHVVRVADDGEDGGGGGCQLRGRVCPRRPSLEQRLRTRACSVVDGHGIARIEHVAAHRAAHDAGADPAYAQGLGGSGGAVLVAGARWRL
jgi:hypothetical protein